MDRCYFTYEQSQGIDGKFRYRILQIGLTLEEAQNVNPVNHGENGPKISYGTYSELAQVQSKGFVQSPEPTCSILESVDRSDGSRRFRIKVSGLLLREALNGVSNQLLCFVVDDFTVEQLKIKGLIVP